MATKRVSPQSVIIGLAVVVALGLAVGFVYVQFFAPPANTGIQSIAFSQSQAVPDFDGSDYTIDDEKDVAVFRALLDEHGVVPGLYFAMPDDGCSGGVSTDITVTYDDGSDARLNIYDCGDVDAFTEEATSFFSEYRTAQG